MANGGTSNRGAVSFVFSLPDLVALAADESPNATTLSPLTIQLLLTAADIINDYELWAGAGYELTSDEKDQIDAMIAQMVTEVSL